MEGADNENRKRFKDRKVRKLQEKFWPNKREERIYAGMRIVKKF